MFISRTVEVERGAWANRSLTVDLWVQVSRVDCQTDVWQVVATLDDTKEIFVFTWDRGFARWRGAGMPYEAQDAIADVAAKIESGEIDVLKVAQQLGR
jgi:hypothetical protein